MSGLQKFLPTVAGQAIINGGNRARNVNELSPWVGLGVFAVYAAVALCLAAYSLVRRDA